MTGQLPTTWHIAGITLVSVLVFIRRWVASRHIILVCLFCLPGVVLHELCHLAAGILFRAAPTGFNLIPERSADGWTLGSVEFGRVTAFNAVPIAFAPLALLFLAYETFLHWRVFFPYPTLLSTLGLYATVFVLAYESLPSIQDLRVATNWRSMALYAPLITGLLWLRFGKS